MKTFAATLIGAMALGAIAATPTPANAAASFGFSFGGPGYGFEYYDRPYYRCGYYSRYDCYPRYYAPRYYGYPYRRYNRPGYWWNGRYYYR